MNGNIYVMRLLLDLIIHTRTHSRAHVRIPPFQCIVQYLLIAQIGLCQKKNSTRLNKIINQSKTLRWQVDEEAISLS